MVAMVSTDEQLELDAIDVDVIGLLQEDGRQSTSGMARVLGLTESTVRRRVDRLLRDGFIRIVAVADSQKIGLPVHVIMGLSIDISRSHQVAAAVAALREARWVAATTGPYDLMLEAYFHDTSHLHTFVTRDLAEIDGMERVESAIVLNLTKHSYDWRQLMSPRTSRTPAPVEIDTAATRLPHRTANDPTTDSISKNGDGDGKASRRLVGPGPPAKGGRKKE
jgi:Lrp/AsnC family transcriptional regulator for asnA, asnC and gidA